VTAGLIQETKQDLSTWRSPKRLKIGRDQNSAAHEPNMQLEVEAAKFLFLLFLVVFRRSYGKKVPWTNLVTFRCLN
jgi:hypothetical protein